MQYAIVDIETTGGYAAGSGISEVAILIHDGERVLEHFETLINPQHPIPLSIQVLTGINDEMVSNSPIFAQVSGRIYELLSNRVFVAHQVNFDYSFIKYHLAMEGYDFSSPKLCTVRLSRKIWPGLPSYSLGRLCNSLNIPLNNRHRAGGDAEATAILFSMIYARDTAGHIQKMIRTGSKEAQLPPNLPREDYEALPFRPGVYYFLDKAGKVIYVGKAKDLRRRVSSHFTGNNPHPQRQHFLRNIYSIRYELCGTELMAFLLEAAEIKRLWPRFNRAMKHFEPKFGLYAYEDMAGYLHLAIGRLGKNQLAIHVFYHQTDGLNTLHKLVRKFSLCPELCMLGNCTGECSCHASTGCNPSDQPVKMPPENYNRLVRDALQHLNTHLPSFAIMDQGRNEEEKSCIWVEKGLFYGMGYISQYGDLQLSEEVKELLTPYTGNHYMIQLIYDYAAKYPHKVVSLD